jgi:hypothetical protein
MISTVTSTEEFLLSNWVEVIKVKEGAEMLQKKIDKLFDIIKIGLQNSAWWTEEFVPPVYRNDGLFFWKKTWYFGNNQHDTIQIGIDNLSLDNLLGITIEKPIACVWTQERGTNRQYIKEFQHLFNDYTTAIQASFDFPIISEHEYALYYELPYTPQQWVNVLRESRFVEIILSHCNILARCVTPIDKVLNAIRTKNRNDTMARN